MARTARMLQDISDKVIVLTGASQPARFYSSNAIFNIGCAIAAVQTLTPDGLRAIGPIAERLAALEGLDAQTILAMSDWIDQAKQLPRIVTH